MRDSTSPLQRSPRFPGADRGIAAPSAPTLETGSRGRLPLAADLLLVISSLAFCTLRHEASHALMALLLGTPVTRFVFWPTIVPGRGLVFGTVGLGAPAGWLPTAAPYLGSVLTLPLFLWLCTSVRLQRRSVRTALELVGVVWPATELTFGYLAGLLGQGDVAHLLRAAPVWPVHGFFAVGMGACAVALTSLSRQGRGPDTRRLGDAPGGPHGG